MPRHSTAAPPSITARPSPEEKDRFAVLARSRGLSESALALSAIRAVINRDSGCLDPYATGPSTAATDRITIRLRPGDGQAIAQRSAQREMRPSAYLAALKRSVVLLARLGTLLAHAVRHPALSGPLLDDLRENMARTRAAVAALEQGTHELVRAALISWESRGD